MKQKTISIDFDDTFTTHPYAWGFVIRFLQSYGFKFICATARTESPANKLDLTNTLPQNVSLVFCGGEAKRTACEKTGHKVDIWIDDMPETIGMNSKPSVLCIMCLRILFYKYWIKLLEFLRG